MIQKPTSDQPTTPNGHLSIPGVATCRRNDCDNLIHKCLPNTHTRTAQRGASAETNRRGVPVAAAGHYCQQSRSGGAWRHIWFDRPGHDSQSGPQQGEWAPASGFISRQPPHPKCGMYNLCDKFIIGCGGFVCRICCSRHAHRWLTSVPPKWMAVGMEYVWHTNSICGISQAHRTTMQCVCVFSWTAQWMSENQISLRFHVCLVLRWWVWSIICIFGITMFNSWYKIQLLSVSSGIAARAERAQNTVPPIVGINLLLVHFNNIFLSALSTFHYCGRPFWRAAHPAQM